MLIPKFQDKKMHLVVYSLVLFLICIVFFIYIIEKSRTFKQPDDQKKEVIENSENQLTEIPSDNPNLRLPTRLPQSGIPTAPPTPIAKTGDIFLDGIPVHNFLDNSIPASEGEVIVADNELFNIMFNTKSSEFTIMVFGDNISQSRQLAEREFLAKLGINEANACRLFVTEIVGKSLDNSNQTQLPLSFCVHND